MISEHLPWHDATTTPPPKEGFYTVTDGKNTCVGSWCYFKEIKRWAWSYPDVIEWVTHWREREEESD